MTNTRDKSRVVKWAKRGQCGRMVDAIKAGEPVNSTDSEWRSALFHAALRGNKSCLKELLRRGGDPNQRNRNGLTPCHAAVMGGGSPRFPTDEVASTRNPVRGAWLITKGTYSVLSYYMRDRRRYRRCLEYLVEYGGDLKVRALTRETVMGLAVRMRKMSIVQFIEECLTPSLMVVSCPQSLLRPTASYPRSCPRWMHCASAGVGGASLDNVSLLHSQASLYHGRMRNVYDYGFVYPFGSRVSPGAASGVPEVMPMEVTRSPQHQCTVGDGSILCRGSWQKVPVTVRALRHQPGLMTMDQLLEEMDALTLLRHPRFPLLMAVSCGPARSDVFAVLEPLQRRPLHHMLHRLDPVVFQDKDRAHVISGVCDALSYLHNIQGTVHCLISSHSLLLTSKGTPKLINLFSLTAEGESVGKLAPLKVFVPWMAPELLEKLIANTSCDVYSLGVLVWELWGGEEPWVATPLPEVYRLVRSGIRLGLSERHSRLSSLLTQCFGAPESRPTISKVRDYMNKLGTTSDPNQGDSSCRVMEKQPPPFAPTSTPIV